MIDYMWVIEEDGHSCRVRRLSEFPICRIQEIDHKNCILSLAREDWDHRSVCSQSYARVKVVNSQMILPDLFENGRRIPKGFRRELEKLNLTLMNSVVQ